MGRRMSVEMTMDEYDDWQVASQRMDSVHFMADEEGGPRISMLPVPDTCETADAFDTVDMIAPVVDGAGGRHLVPVPFDPVPSRKAVGWSADRQRTFIRALAETGSVHLAARAAGLSARSAYSLRVRSQPFANAWDMAQQLAVGRLSALAFDRAIHGRVEQVYHGQTLISEKRVPSDRMLMWLLARLDPIRFGASATERDPQRDAAASFPALLHTLTDEAAETPQA